MFLYLKNENWTSTVDGVAGEASAVRDADAARHGRPDVQRNVRRGSVAVAAGRRQTSLQSRRPARFGAPRLPSRRTALHHHRPRSVFFFIHSIDLFESDAKENKSFISYPGTAVIDLSKLDLSTNQGQLSQRLIMWCPLEKPPTTVDVAPVTSATTRSPASALSKVLSQLMRHSLKAVIAKTIKMNEPPRFIILNM